MRSRPSVRRGRLICFVKHRPRRGDVHGHTCLLRVTELRELDNLKSDLISFVSHELRNAGP